MDALHTAIRRIHSDPVHPTSSVLFALIKSLDDGQEFDLTRLYQLNYHDFGLALDLMKQWRLDSFCYERGRVTKVAGDPASMLEYPVWSGAQSPPS